MHMYLQVNVKKGHQFHSEFTTEVTYGIKFGALKTKKKYKIGSNKFQ